MIIRNINNSLRIIISIPHSGTNYSRDFLKNILLSKKYNSSIKSISKKLPVFIDKFKKIFNS